MFSQLHLEVPWLPLYANYLSIGKKFDILVPSTLHQFGSHYAHSAVVGGKGFVQLSHHPADSSLVIHQIDLVARPSQVQGCLSPSNASAHDQHRSHGAWRSLRLLSLLRHFYPRLLRFQLRDDPYSDLQITDYFTSALSQEVSRMNRVWVRLTTCRVQSVPRSSTYPRQSGVSREDPTWSSSCYRNHQSRKAFHWL